MLLDDSKKLTAARRDAAFAALLRGARAGLLEHRHRRRLGRRDRRLNILRASQLAMARALARLPARPDLALVDGNQPPKLPCPVRCVVGGDAASLLDRGGLDPGEGGARPGDGAARCALAGYGFAAHQGYPTGGASRGAGQARPDPASTAALRPVDQALAAFEGSARLHGAHAAAANARHRRQRASARRASQARGCPRRRRGH
jgi:ribonuclease HII